MTFPLTKGWQNFYINHSSDPPCRRSATLQIHLGTSTTLQMPTNCHQQSLTTLQMPNTGIILPTKWLATLQIHSVPREICRLLNALYIDPWVAIDSQSNNGHSSDDIALTACYQIGYSSDGLKRLTVPVFEYTPSDLIMNQRKYECATIDPVALLKTVDTLQIIRHTRTPPSNWVLFRSNRQGTLQMPQKDLEIQMDTLQIYPNDIDGSCRRP